ncbi:hypothetical protein [Chryseobacterium luquanense]|uniref:Lipocalin-like domain-containing protein n=1 Tax=Chryseobacterium luquanense TaxID=2983766 RepID=A0ABT3XY77_9FLAO|nr:hypothetical protein [Chryseobacterium luquanense]MCX8530827.1 hypothetical protein [Chryseobacterium luquanense]
MKNLTTYKVIFLLAFISCTNKIIVSDAPMLKGTWTVESDIKNNISSKKTGTFQYPNLGMEYNLRNGKFTGVFKIIAKNNDTLFYANYENNLPIGKYISKRLDYNEQVFHHRTIPVNSKLNYGVGTGNFNENHTKEGFWNEVVKKYFIKMEKLFQNRKLFFVDIRDNSKRWYPIILLNYSTSAFILYYF